MLETLETVAKGPTAGSRVHANTAEVPEEIFRQNYARLVQTLTIIGGDREAAEDAVQESFVQLVVRWNKIAGYQDPAGWLRRVALNRLIDHQRSLKRRAELILRLGGGGAPVTDLSPREQAVWEAIKKLPQKQRTAVALHFVGGFTILEVAAAMEVTEGTVNQHLHRARAALREVMEEER